MAPAQATADDVPSAYEVEIVIRAPTTSKAVGSDDFSTVPVKILVDGGPDPLAKLDDTIVAVWKARTVPHNGRRP